ncbi:cation:proton antiporter [uncultured Parasphingorhabdus sp.]|uniref:cation:proton antiporter n=1 Tax=uncultured Parasphingorhabdus sp. TaxID=2709694 RepID=UPI0030DAB08A
MIMMVAWLPLILKRMPLSLPIICVISGIVLFSFPPFEQYSPHPVEAPIIIEMATELIVIISLMGAGLKISRPFSLDGWKIPIRLLGVAMPLTIIAVAFLGGYYLGLPLPAALLLGACLAPTDPVLASDVQILSTESADEDDARFSLTTEAGLNDALAFPFIHLAIAASFAGFGLDVWTSWISDDLLLRLFIGSIIGILAGKLIGKIIYALPKTTRLSRTGDGFVALGVTLIVYSVTEFAHGYGFLAVFLAGLMLRKASDGHGFNKRLHDFADETERLLMMFMLVFFGGMISKGGLFSALGTELIVFAVLTILVIRPVIGWCSLMGLSKPSLDKFTISFFGIRGLGSAYYLSFALNHGNFGSGDLLWEIVALVICISIFVHGILVTPAMALMERSHLR